MQAKDQAHFKNPSSSRYCHQSGMETIFEINVSLAMMSISRWCH